MKQMKPKSVFHIERAIRYRDLAGLSQEEVAAFCDVSAQAVGNWENARNRPKPANVLKLAELYQCHATDLMSPFPGMALPESERDAGGGIDLADGEGEYMRTRCPEPLKALCEAWPNLDAATRGSVQFTVESLIERIQKYGLDNPSTRLSLLEPMHRDGDAPHRPSVNPDCHCRVLGSMGE